VTDVIVRRAGDLAEDHALKGFDAIHLASRRRGRSYGIARTRAWWPQPSESTIAP
jgi:hypothetical protein